MAQAWRRAGVALVAGWLACGLACAAVPQAAAQVQAEAIGPGIERLRLTPPGATAADAERGWAVLPREAGSARASANDSTMTTLRSRLDVRLVPTNDGHVRASFALRPGERVYGLGDKAGPLDRRGRTFT